MAALVPYNMLGLTGNVERLKLHVKPLAEHLVGGDLTSVRPYATYGPEDVAYLHNMTIGQAREYLRDHPDSKNLGVTMRILGRHLLQDFGNLDGDHGSLRDLPNRDLITRPDTAVVTILESRNPNDLPIGMPLRDIDLAYLTRASVQGVVADLLAGRFGPVRPGMTVCSDDVYSALTGRTRQDDDEIREPSFDAFVTRKIIHKLRPELSRKRLDALLRKTERFAEYGEGSKTYRWGSFLDELGKVSARSRQRVDLDNKVTKAAAFGRHLPPAFARKAKSASAQAFIESIGQS